MQLRTLWQVILKVVGLFCGIATINVVAVILSGNPNGISDDMQFILSELLILIVESVIAFLLLYRTNELIDRLKLVSSMEERNLQFTFDAKKVLRLSIAIIGLYNLSQAIPELFVSGSSNSTPSILYSLSKIAIALLMILKSDELEHLFFKNYDQKESKKDSDPDL